MLVGAPGRVATGTEVDGVDCVGRDAVRVPADGTCGTDVRWGRVRPSPGWADGAAGAIDVAGTGRSEDGDGLGDVVTTVDSPGPAGSTGSGGPGRGA
ncbi:hypothetical protein H480_04147, partial [Amycolatopsis vancoresmycina DSM 44592]